MRRVIGTVVNGKFVDAKPEKRTEHSLHKQYQRDYHRDQFAQDIVQPWKGGKPNAEYIQAYGKTHAKDYFTKDQIREAMNNG